MQKILRAVGIALRAVVCVAAGLLLLYNGYILFARYALKEEMPTVFGFAVAQVVSGSMEPQISIGDMIVTRAAEEYAVGDVIMFRDGDGTYTTHRIIALGEDTYITQGDANSAADDPVARGDVVGKVVAVAENAGKVIGFLRDPLVLFAVLGVGALIWLATELLPGRGKDEQTEKGDHGEEKKG